MVSPDLPWAPPLGGRCRARLSRVDSPDYFGRCELRRHWGTVDHALERGMVVLRWSSTTRLESA